MIASFRGRLTLLFGAVLLVFGLVADHLARDELRRALGAKLEKRGVAIARDLAAMSTDAIITGDDFALLQILERTKANNPDTRYLFLVDAQGGVLASTLGNRMPRGLLGANRVSAREAWRLKRFSTDEGIVRDIAVPMVALGGMARVGMSDESLVTALSSYSLTLSLTLAALLLAGLLVSYGLAGFLTRPLDELIAAVRSVGRGKLDETIPSPGRDEVGELAIEFNAMTRSLGEKEAMRQALLEKVITTQEDERKRVARDLHDDLSQSLAYVLMRLEELESRLTVADEASRAALGQAREVLGTSLVQMRRLIADLRPTILDAGHAGAGFPAGWVLATLIVSAIAWAYVKFGTLPQVGGLLYGVKPVIIAVVLQAIWSLGRSAIKTPLHGALAIATLALAIWGVNELALLFGAGLVWAVRQWLSRSGGAAGSRVPGIGLFPAVGVPAAVAAALPVLPQGRIGHLRERLRPARLSRRGSGRAVSLAHPRPAPRRGCRRADHARAGFHDGDVRRLCPWRSGRSRGRHARHLPAGLRLRGDQRPPRAAYPEVAHCRSGA